MSAEGSQKNGRIYRIDNKDEPSRCFAAQQRGLFPPMCVHGIRASIQAHRI